MNNIVQQLLLLIPREVYVRRDLNENQSIFSLPPLHFIAFLTQLLAYVSEYKIIYDWLTGDEDMSEKLLK